MPVRAFLNAYPFLACIFATTPDRNQRHISLEPIFTNAPYQSLLTDSEGNTYLWVKALGTSHQASSFAQWLTSNDAPVLVVNLMLFQRERPVQLQLCKTLVGDMWAITSTPLLDASTVYGSQSSVRPSRSTSPTPSEESLEEESVLPTYSSVYRMVTREDMNAFTESFDWATTPMGYPKTWPQSLKTMWSIITGHEGPACILWGKDQVLLYNAKYASTILAQKHPLVFGKKGVEAWGEIWEVHGPLAIKVMTEGITIHQSEDLFFFDRLLSSSGRFLPEEVYITWSWVPAKGENEEIVGIFNISFDTTEKILSERRMHCLRHVSERSALTHTRIQFIESVLAVLHETTYEAPFAAIYAYSPNHRASLDTLSGSFSRPHSSPIFLSLVGSVGVPGRSERDTHSLFRPYFPVNAQHGILWASSMDVGFNVSGPIISQDTNATPNTAPSLSTQPSPDSITPCSSQNASDGFSTRDADPAFFDWAPYFAQAHHTQKPILVSNLPPDVMTDVGRDRCWNDVVREALIIPIAVESNNAEDSGVNEDVLSSAILIVGVNTRVPYSHEGAYGQWAEIMRLSLGASLTAVIGREREAQHLKKMAELDAAKTSFFSNASHELRTPLTLIAGPIQDALESTDDPKLKSQLELASRSISRLKRLIDSLMDFSKIAGGQLRGHFRPCQLGRLVADLAAMFRSTIEGHSMDYVVDCDQSEERLTLVDPEAMERIVFNLIGNAFKFTVSGSIAVRVVYKSDTVILSISDTGVGIPTGELGKIFQRFYRVQTTSRSHEGTGIGLALTAELVKLHGGTLTVQSTPQSESPTNHGSTFSAEFPLGMDHIPWAAVDNDDARPNVLRSYGRGILEEAAEWGRNDVIAPTVSFDSSPNPHTTPTSLTSVYSFEKSDLILVVEDNADMRDYLRVIFSPFCQVVVAIHGAQALDLMKSHHPRLLISDVVMPVMSGLELCAAVRSDPELRLTPIILLTAQADEEAQLYGLTSGADDYLSKPFSSRELIARAHLQLQIGKERVQLQSKFDVALRERQVLTDLAPGIILRGDSQRNIIWANPMWHELTGMPLAESLNNWGSYVHPDDIADAAASWHQVFDMEQPQIFECRFINGNLIRANIAPFRNVDDTLGVMGTLTDVTEIRRLEAAQIKLAEEREATARRKAEEAEERRLDAEERRRAQELLIDVTSHELRQPISACLNSTLLVRSNLSELREQLAGSLQSSTPFYVSPTTMESLAEDLDALDSVYESGLSQERIANDVLSLSRMQLEVLSIIPSSFDLVKEVHRTCALFNTELQIKGIRFTLKVGESIARLGVRWVHLDRARFSQVITNLMSNAIKFTTLGNDEHMICLTLETSIDTPSDSSCKLPPPRYPSRPIPASSPVFIYISVRDSGPGLTPEDLASLFQRFAQGSNSHQVFGGSGLGLFISRKLCDLMGGRIEVISEYGQGANFRLFVRASMGTPPSGTAAHIRKTISHAQIASQEHMRVLITEDNRINQTVLNRQLKKAGCITTLASNGLEAITAVKQTHTSDDSFFNVILMDCEMPVMDGYTAVRELRQLEASRAIVRRHYVIALTGNARSAQVQSALDAGMDTVVTKPYKINELLELMRQGMN